MRFLFVSRIHQIEGSRITGQMTFGSQEPWRRSLGDNNSEVSLSVVSEAIGQLVSWLSLKDNDFTARPVFLFANKIQMDGSVPAPSTVELEAWITDRDENSFIFSGTAKVDGRTVVEIQDCGGYFMPLGELEDPSVTRQRFQALISTGLGENPPGQEFDTRLLVDDVKDLAPGTSIAAVKVMRPDEPFYPDHFPRFPVTPIVVINEMIAEATSRMMTEQGASTGLPSNGKKHRISPSSVRDLKIKSFIRPGDTAVIQVKTLERLDDEFETVAEIMVNQKRILRGRYRYRLA